MNHHITPICGNIPRNYLADYIDVEKNQDVRRIGQDTGRVDENTPRMIQVVSIFYVGEEND